MAKSQEPSKPTEDNTNNAGESSKQGLHQEKDDRTTGYSPSEAQMGQTSSGVIENPDKIDPEVDPKKVSLVTKTSCKEPQNGVNDVGAEEPGTSSQASPNTQKSSENKQSRKKRGFGDIDDTPEQSNEKKGKRICMESPPGTSSQAFPNSQKSSENKQSRQNREFEDIDVTSEQSFDEEIVESPLGDVSLLIGDQSSSNGAVYDDEDGIEVDPTSLVTSSSSIAPQNGVNDVVAEAPGASSQVFPNSQKSSENEQNRQNREFEDIDVTSEQSFDEEMMESLSEDDSWLFGDQSSSNGAVYDDEDGIEVDPTSLVTSSSSMVPQNGVNDVVAEAPGTSSQVFPNSQKSSENVQNRQNREFEDIDVTSEQSFDDEMMESLSEDDSWLFGDQSSSNSAVYDDEDGIEVDPTSLVTSSSSMVPQNGVNDVVAEAPGTSSQVFPNSQKSSENVQNRQNREFEDIDVTSEQSFDDEMMESLSEDDSWLFGDQSSSNSAVYNDEDGIEVDPTSLVTSSSSMVPQNGVNDVVAEALGTSSQVFPNSQKSSENEQNRQNREFEDIDVTSEQSFDEEMMESLSEDDSWLFGDQSSSNGAMYDDEDGIEVDPTSLVTSSSSMVPQNGVNDVVAEAPGTSSQVFPNSQKSSENEQNRQNREFEDIYVTSEQSFDEEMMESLSEDDSWLFGDQSSSNGAVYDDEDGIEVDPTSLVTSSSSMVPQNVVNDVVAEAPGTSSQVFPNSQKSSENVQNRQNREFEDIDVTSEQSFDEEMMESLSEDDSWLFGDQSSSNSAVYDDEDGIEVDPTSLVTSSSSIAPQNGVNDVVAEAPGTSSQAFPNSQKSNENKQNRQNREFGDIDVTSEQSFDEEMVELSSEDGSVFNFSLPPSPVLPFDSEDSSNSVDLNYMQQVFCGHLNAEEPVTSSQVSPNSQNRSENRQSRQNIEFEDIDVTPEQSFDGEMVESSSEDDSVFNHALPPSPVQPFDSDDSSYSIRFDRMRKFLYSSLNEALQREVDASNDLAHNEGVHNRANIAPPEDDTMVVSSTVGSFGLGIEQPENTEEEQSDVDLLTDDDW